MTYIKIIFKTQFCSENFKTWKTFHIFSVLMLWLQANSIWSEERCYEPDFRKKLISSPESYNSLCYNSPSYSDYNRNFVSLQQKLLQQLFFTFLSKDILGIESLLGSRGCQMILLFAAKTLTRILKKDLFDFSEPDFL